MAHAWPPRKKPQGWGPGGLTDTKCGRPTTRSGDDLRALQKTALLVLLARSARARIVAPHFLSSCHARLATGLSTYRRHRRLPAAPFLPARCHGHCRALLRDRLLATRAYLEELLDLNFLQVVDHFLEHLEGFFLVFHQRIPLAVPTESDAFFQVVHVQQVLAPELVDPAEPATIPLEPEHDPALQSVEQLTAERGFSLPVALLGRASHQLLQLGLGRQLLGVGIGRQSEIELPKERLVEALEVPVFWMRIGARVALDDAVRELAHPLEDGLFLALVFETLTTQPVDDFPLLVHHVVVLEQVLSDLEVARFNALLGRADRSRDQLVLDRLALLHAEPVHDALDPLGAEDPEEVVLEGQVEPGR